MMMPSITSNELNYLIFRYLQESGFTHAAFALGYEAGINKSPIDGNLIPPGALITFVQRGLQYIELEANLSNSEVDGDDDFSFIQPLDLITKDVHELRQIIKGKKESLQKERGKEKEKDKEFDQEHQREQGCQKEREKQEIEKEREREKGKIEKDKKQDNEKDKEMHQEDTYKELGRDHEESIKRKPDENGVYEAYYLNPKYQHTQQLGNKPELLRALETVVSRLEKDPIQQAECLREVKWFKDRTGSFGRPAAMAAMDNTPPGAEPMDITPSAPSLTCEVPSSDVTILEGHTSEVFACAWSPMGSLLASGSGDSTARIWNIPSGPCGSSMQIGLSSAIVLKHFKGRTNEKSKDVTTLDWNVEGTLLATGSYDGHARVWDRNGELKNILSRHRGPIFSLKWNKNGDYLLSGSVDKTAIVWDMKTGEFKQQFDFHSAPTLDVDWRSSVTFATCSTDNMICYCKIGENHPIKRFIGHQGEVNAIKWDPSGTLLASCSDDMTAKIWTLKQDKCIHDFKEHSKEIYTIRWSPTGPGTSNANQQLLLASASFDSTIKLWEVELGSLLYSLNGHRQPVYSVAFSPNGEYLASGSLDQCLHVWSVKEGKIVKTYRGGGGLFEVCWNREGDKIAACFSDNTVCVLDFRM